MPPASLVFVNYIISTSLLLWEKLLTQTRGRQNDNIAACLQSCYNTTRLNLRHAHHSERVMQIQP
uniref:Uncharacterized protein n=1 Tax=Anguilla anguilla TaxID=7936 RepID=A0A0E9UJA2_ANGAN